MAERIPLTRLIRASIVTPQPPEGGMKGLFRKAFSSQ
jgi:hypothetical protein